jgi:hypothetical protein
MAASNSEFPEALQCYQKIPDQAMDLRFTVSDLQLYTLLSTSLNRKSEIVQPEICIPLLFLKGNRYLHDFDLTIST